MCMIAAKFSVVKHEIDLLRELQLRLPLSIVRSDSGLRGMSESRIRRPSR
jgi:hypothetical protein